MPCMRTQTSLTQEPQNFQNVTFAPEQEVETPPVSCISCEISICSSSSASTCMEAEPPTMSPVSNETCCGGSKKLSCTKTITSQAIQAPPVFLPLAKFTAGRDSVAVTKTAGADASLKSLLKDGSFLLNRNQTQRANDFIISEESHNSDSNSTHNSLESTQSLLDAAILVSMEASSRHS